MAMVVNHNIPALQTYNTVNRTNAALEKSIQKLSTGLRINSAADDAAGLAISEKMRSQIRGMDRAVSNAQDGISMIQTAEGALNETHDILQRMRELSVQAANDTLTSQDRSYIQLEIDELRDEVTRIGNTTQFNKKKLLNGDAAVLWSSDNLETKAIVNGGLRSIDQFGQKVVTEGNYKISIKAEPGQAEVQKSDLFKVKHENVVMNKSVDTSTGATDVAVDKVPAGSYTVAGKAVQANKVNFTGVFGVEENYNEWKQTLNAAVTEDTTPTKGTLKVTFGGETLDIDLTAADTAANNGDKIRAAINNKFGQNLVASGTGATVELKSTKGAFSTSITKPSGATDPASGTGAATGPTAQSKSIETDYVTLENASADKNASVLFEVTGVNVDAGTVTVKASVTAMGTDGSISSKVEDDIVLSSTVTNLGERLGLGAEDAVTMKLNAATGIAEHFHVGDKFTYNLTSTDGDVALEASGTQNTEWPKSWGAKVTENALQYNVTAADVAGKDIHMKHYYLNENTGEVMEGDIILSTDKDTFDDTNPVDKTLATFDAAYVGQVAKGDVAIRDLDKFWTSEGVFMVTDPQTITLTQGDGKQATVTLYATDTLNDVASKFNDAIANGLGQGQYVEKAADGRNFATFTESAGANSESVPGTFLIRSIIPGASGAISLAGDENVINAFSLNLIQDARESKYTVDIKDAHTGADIASGVKVTGNLLKGVVHENVDVVFDPMAGIKVSWDDANKQFTYSANDNYSTVLHLSDNTTVFQIGANEGEDMGVHIGDMRANALGIDKVNVTSRETASRSITILDNAIDKVSTQRAKLGAYQNRLEHTVNNLNTASENITAAESRIRDTDMAKEMMNFTKLQIMLQAGTSMLAQANQLPQNVMALVR